jgi:hypothetical protein
MKFKKYLLKASLPNMIVASEGINGEQNSQSLNFTTLDW